MARRSDQDLKAPVIVCGAARSGKTTLCALLDESPELATWSEPNAMLRAGRAYRRHDVATAADATPRVIRRMRSLCLKYQEAHDDARVVIESPIACFQIPFLAAVFPGLRVLHVCSNGRYVFDRRRASEDEVLAAGIGTPDNRDRMLEQFRQMFWWEIPAYLPRFVHMLVRPYAGRFYRRWFGVRYFGWQADFRRLDESAIIAKQWAKSVAAAMEGLAAVPEGRANMLAFEDFLARPAATIDGVLTFCGATHDADIAEKARIIARQVNEAVAAAGGPAPEPEPRLVDILEPSLSLLGYR